MTARRRLWLVATATLAVVTFAVEPILVVGAVTLGVVCGVLRRTR